jgi:dihydrolipoamide dehydrogenase
MSGSHFINTEVVVLGGGPGGYTAAFRAADLGKKVVLIEKYDSLGGVCLNRGCIPSKILLHAVKVMDDAEEISGHGIEFSKPNINLEKLREWKNSIISKLSSGLTFLAKQRQVEIIRGVGKFISDHQIEIVNDQNEKTILTFEHAVIAAGSEPTQLPFLPNDSRIIDSTGALALTDIPKSMLIIGGGIIGLEMAAVYHALGTEISIVDIAPQIIPMVDADIIAPLFRRIRRRYKNIWLETTVTQVDAQNDGLYVSFQGKKAPTEPMRFDKILCAVGRSSNGKTIGAENAGIIVNKRGFITVNKKQQTSIPHIFAIGDVVGNPMLAHKASAEGRLAAENIAGLNKEFTQKCIPSVAYTDPEIAWVGITEKEAIEKNMAYGKGVFPWAANGRSLSYGRNDGITKILFNKDSNEVIGASIVGPNAGDLIAEITLAIEKGCKASDLSHTIHPHPTLSETIMTAAEVFEGTVTELFIKK